MTPTRPGLLNAFHVTSPLELPHESLFTPHAIIVIKQATTILKHDMKAA